MDPMTTAILARPTNAIGQLLRRAVGWWLAELAQVMPPWLLRLFGKPGDPTSILQLGGSELTLFLADRRRQVPIVVPLTGFGDNERRMRIQAVLRSHRASDAVAVRLDRSLVFETGIELPLSAEGSLRPILEHQIERLVPLSSPEACFAYRIAARSPFANTLDVRLTITKNETIERALALARGDGLSPRLVVAPPAEGAANGAGAGAPAILWQAKSGRSETLGHRRLRHGLGILAVLLSLSAYGLYVHRLDQVRSDLQARIDRDRPVAAAVQRLGQQIGRTAAELAFFRDRRQAPPPLAIVAALTKLVPLDSWARQLTVRGQTVEISGSSPRATDLISRAEKSAMFENPQFRSPITLSTDGKSERFDLSLDIKKGEAR